MDPQTLRNMRRSLRESSKHYGPELQDVPTTHWPPNTVLTPIRVLRSRDFLVQVYIEDGPVIRLSVCRTELDNDGGWKDGITWDELQSIKAQCGYADRDAVEIYPAQEDVVNVANMRHLWVLSCKLEFGWRAYKRNAPGNCAAK